MRKIEFGDICENGTCRHLATIIWIGDSGSLAMSREHMQSKWCQCCTIKAQLEYAEAAAKRVRSLRKMLKEACQ